MSAVTLPPVGSDEEVAMAVEEDAAAAILKAVFWMVFKCFRVGWHSFSHPFIVIVAVGCSHVGGIEGDSAVGHDVTVVGVALLCHVMIILSALEKFHNSNSKFKPKAKVCYLDVVKIPSCPHTLPILLLPKQYLKSRTNCSVESSLFWHNIKK